MPLLVFAPCKFHAEKVAGLRGQTPEPPSKRAKPHGAQPNREKAPTASPPTVTSPGHWQSVWKGQASLGIHRTSSQNELSAMATEAWTHPQRQENRDTGTSGSCTAVGAALTLTHCSVPNHQKATDWKLKNYKMVDQQIMSINNTITEVNLNLINMKCNLLSQKPY
ncbi:Signal Peptide Peptidase-Like 2B [Manis pentadactyla]|nr:Signal Peptide Peptidase-Like 2B [Manis pentadactyla]